MKTTFRVTGGDHGAPFFDIFVDIDADFLKKPVRLEAPEALDLAVKLLKSLGARGAFAKTPGFNTFETLIYWALSALDLRDEYAKYVHKGKLGSLGYVRYVLAKDLAAVASEIDVDNFMKSVSEDDGWKIGMVSSICRDVIKLPVVRAGNHGGASAIVLDRKKMWDFMTSVIEGQEEIS